MRAAPQAAMSVLVAAGVVLSWPGRAHAQAVTSEPVVQLMLGWVWWMAMVSCFLAVVSGGGWWGVSIWRKERDGIDRALKILLGGIAGSVIVGGAAGIANATLELSLHHQPCVPGVTC